jgi:penicillin-binding protein 1A
VLCGRISGTAAWHRGSPLSRCSWPGTFFPEDISGQDRTIRRKLREVQVAYDIERNFPKDKILEFYLNQIDLGNRAYGVESASQRYFGKSVRDLNVAEAATLARSPRRRAGITRARIRISRSIVATSS